MKLAASNRSVRLGMPIVLVVSTLVGCGTTRWSDTTRTATEQLLISDAIDRAVSNFDLRALAGKQIYLDTTYLRNVVDADYLVSSLRQHTLASGCILKAKPDEADYIVEIRTGSVGTDHHDVLFGIPATNVPATAFTAGVPAQVPELPLWKRTEQRAVAKIGLFAYNRQTGRPIWQSGLVPVESSAKAVWVFGAGPFRKGHIHQGTDFAGEKINIPLLPPGEKPDRIPVASEAYFAEPPRAAEIAWRDLGPAAPPVALPPVQGPAAWAANPSPAATANGSAPPSAGVLSAPQAGASQNTPPAASPPAGTPQGMPAGLPQGMPSGFAPPGGAALR